jgi:hypothetical protein
VIFGAVAISAATFGNQFMNMKNKMGDIGDELDDIEDANQGYRIGRLENKTQFIEIVESSNYTVFNCNLRVQDYLYNDTLTFDRYTGKLKTNKIESSYLQTTDLSVDNITSSNTTLKIGESNKIINISGSNIFLGSPNPFDEPTELITLKATNIISDGSINVTENLNVSGNANIGSSTSVFSGSTVNIKGSNINIGEVGSSSLSSVNINGIIFVNGSILYQNGFFNQL